MGAAARVREGRATPQSCLNQAGRAQSPALVSPGWELEAGADASSSFYGVWLRLSWHHWPRDDGAGGRKPCQAALDE